MSVAQSPILWNPTALFNEDPPSFAFLLLNQPILNKPKFLSFWNRSRLKVAVDGGSERLKESLGEDIIPDLITGDFDSASQPTLEFYRDRGSEIIHTPDQDYTDFTKALVQVSKSRAFGELEAVVVYVENSGRLDQIFANIETLFHADRILSGKPTYLVSSDSISWLLRPGAHRINLDSLLPKTAHCGLIPVGAPAKSVTTRGLKWNLNCGELAFGKLVSTSNAFNGEGIVEIETSAPLLWTMDTN